VKHFSEFARLFRDLLCWFRLRHSDNWPAIFSHIGRVATPKDLLARVPAVTVYLSVVMGVLLPAAGIIMLLVWLLSTAYQGLRALVAK
jgi:hypothetical protein